jgi:hypothetical protein
LTALVTHITSSVARRHFKTAVDVDGGHVLIAASVKLLHGDIIAIRFSLNVFSISHLAFCSPG